MSDRQIQFQREHIERLTKQLEHATNKIGVLELRNKQLRDNIERMGNGQGQPEWTEFQEVKRAVFGDGRMVGGKGTDPTGKFVTVINSRYTVAVYRREPEGTPFPVFHLSVKRNDGAAIHDWRDMQRIKNELIGEQYEGCELLPAEERMVDGANQYHIFVLDDPQARFPFGFNARLVSESEGDGIQQRPFEPDQRPDDLQQITFEEIRRVAAQVNVQEID